MTSFRAALQSGLVGAMVAFVVLYSLGLTLLGDALPWAEWFGLVALSLPALVCLVTASRITRAAGPVVLASLALVSYAAGRSYHAWSASRSSEPIFPSYADLGCLAFYPLLVLAVAWAVRRHAKGMDSSVWWDSAMGALGAAAVMAVVLDSEIDALLGVNDLALADAVRVAYPVADVLLVACVAAIGGLVRVSGEDRWALLMAGLLIFAAADIFDLQQQGNTTYVPSIGWAIGLALVAVWVVAVDRSGSAAVGAASSSAGSKSLVVSLVTVVVGLALLVIGTRAYISGFAVGLAAATVLVAVIRFHRTFRLLRLLVDQRRREATTDELTGLANRRVLYAESEARLATSEAVWALVLLDLDRFKEVNDSLGHHVGDELLVQVAERLAKQVRKGDLLSRLGGDEFALLCEVSGRRQALAVAAKLRLLLSEPFAVDGLSLQSGASIGISLFPEDGADIPALLRKADIAMYKAKVSGEGYYLYSSIDDTDRDSEIRTADELRVAMNGDQLVLHYQPKVDLVTGHVDCVEALVRWNHPTRGLLYPDDFLAIVEETGLMREMTRVVLEIALDQAQTWRMQGRSLAVAVNLSASSLVDLDLPAQVAGMLAVRGLPPSALHLEITEDFLMADRDRARKILSRLRADGVQICVDDFGTGYSSLAYLRELPIDELKLDRSFIFPMGDDARALALVASTIGLAHSLGLRMVAEGVETDDAYAELARMGCDQAQGYFTSRPLPAALLDLWLAGRAMPVEAAQGDVLLGSDALD